MRLENLWTVTKREYLTRVRTKAFWISTIVLPLFMGAMIVVPTLIMEKTGTRQELAVVDATGRIGETLETELVRQG